MAGWFPVSALRRGQVLACARRPAGVCSVWLPDIRDRRNDFPGHTDTIACLVPRHVVVTTQKNGASALGLQRVLGLKSYETAWTWLHKFRRAMVRPGRDLLAGRVEVDECYVGGLEEGLPGRLNLKKALVVVAAQEDGPGIGRIRMRLILDASAESLMPFVRDSVVPGSVVHTDGWPGYLPLEKNGYAHDVTVLRGKKKTPSELLPRVHQVISLLKRWLMGTHQGAVSHKHLDYYLDEFTFRFNRRRSRSRGKLFFRLVQQAVAAEPIPLDRILHPDAAKPKNKPQPVGAA
jgi:transposase-like protein